MALLPILHYPDKRLRLIAQAVECVDDELKQLIDDMLETMYEYNGVGLAATQVNVQKRVIVIDVADKGKEPICLINPEILGKEGNYKALEGCLSVPGIYEKVERAAWVSVKALDRYGDLMEFEAEGLLGHAIQHEIDHLNGHLFIDKLSPLKKSMVEKKLMKMKKQNL